MRERHQRRRFMPPLASWLPIADLFAPAPLAAAFAAGAHRATTNKTAGKARRSLMRVIG
jgi:hypothetical protein